ncbi:MAG TPA: SH3 domain-containing protein [Rhodopila sp.]|uniref:SH3 domain-containing protein n=1 Tax=Rhodopila sp. TaxID=2480087 RepID=UPI002D166816|nr:SH3 domain-containing protein [Rhodopila sp.]HVY14798.1 SH3 domain-containing protein [Rhodopila sp.]
MALGWHRTAMETPEAEGTPRKAPLRTVPARIRDKGATTGLPVPRFVALRADKVNMRVGPGLRYPIKWVYLRRNLPVEVRREFYAWRFVRDSDGVEGWMHEATLTGRRCFVVTGKQRALRREPTLGAAVVARLDVGVIGDIRHCSKGAAWCRVAVDGYDGWLRRQSFWGTLPGEAVGH